MFEFSTSVLNPSQSSAVVFESKNPVDFDASIFANSFLMKLSADEPLLPDSFSFRSNYPSGDAYELTTADLSWKLGSAETDFI